MIGKLRVTNIELRYAYTGSGKMGWWAEAKFRDEGWAQDNTIEGTLSTTYGQNIESAIDCIIQDIEKLSIELIKGSYLDYTQDEKTFPPPNNWKKILAEQAKRVGMLVA